MSLIKLTNITDYRRDPRILNVYSGEIQPGGEAYIEEKDINHQIYSLVDEGYILLGEWTPEYKQFRNPPRVQKKEEELPTPETPKKKK